MRGRSSERGKRDALPVDERLVMPETRHEIVDGEVVYVTPADQPHASRHSKLSALLEAHAGEGYDAASDMLTRTSERGDLAPDGSIYPTQPHPETGGRQLEELAFEVVSRESLASAGRKAASLVGRGVRRVFALDVERRRALEWSRSTGTWEMLPRDGVIADRALAVPMPIHDLVSAAKSDDAVARALLAKRNPVLVEALTEARVEARAQGRAEGKLEGEIEGKLEGKLEGNVEGKAQAVVAVLAGRGIPVGSADRSRILSARDPAVLERWLVAAGRCRSARELLSAAAKPRAGRR